MRIIYITRTYAQDTNSSNCTGYRNYTVELLKKKYEVLVVTPNYESDNIIEKDDLVAVPYKFKRMDMWLERVGIYDDYLKRWVDDSLNVLKDKIRNDDMLLAVSGGELGSIMLATKLKDICGCKLIVNFHDPIDATVIDGKKSTLRIHVNRDKALGNLLKYADRIITCSQKYKSVLEKKYKNSICKVENVYLGFRGKIEESYHHTLHAPIHVVYAGTMSPTQGAERFAEIFANRSDIKVIFIGKASEQIIELANNATNIEIVAPMPHDEYIKYIKETADIGLVSLKGKEFGACVPSKIYELINYEIPIFAILPRGDAMDIINGGYGVACERIDTPGILSNYERLVDSKKIEEIRKKMCSDKTEWQMDKLFNKMYKIIDTI